MSSAGPRIVRAAAGEDFAATAAAHIWATMTARESPLVCLPTGRTPQNIYRELLARRGDEKKVWRSFRYLALDEYAGLVPDDERLFAAVLARSILDPAGVPAESRFTFNSLAPDPAAEAARFESVIAAQGPIDLAVLGIGLNGHIAFNEPGSEFTSTTRYVALAPETRRANAGDFGGDETAVPAHAYTVGLGTLAEARSIILLASGAAKAKILAQALRGPVTPQVPASILQTLANVTVIADGGALEGLLS